MPFFRVLPDNPEYPYGNRLGIRYGTRRPRVPCMPLERLEKKMLTTVEGARADLLRRDPRIHTAPQGADAP